MKVRVPFSAPGVEPVQGASRKSMPLLAKRVADARGWRSGEMVLASTTTAPGLRAFDDAVGPRMTLRDMAVLPTHRNTHSEFARGLGGSRAEAAASPRRRAGRLASVVRPQGHVVAGAQKIAGHR